MATQYIIYICINNKPNKIIFILQADFIIIYVGDCIAIFKKFYENVIPVKFYIATNRKNKFFWVLNIFRNPEFHQTTLMIEAELVAFCLNCFRRGDDFNLD